MNLKVVLTERINLFVANQIIKEINVDRCLKDDLFNLIWDEDETVVIQSLWVLSQLRSPNNNWLQSKQEKLIKICMETNHTSIRRLSLSVLNKLDCLCVEDLMFYNFCIEQMSNLNEAVGVRALCIKIAYKYVLVYPDLGQELTVLLEMMDGETSAAVISACNNTLKLLKKDNW